MLMKMSTQISQFKTSNTLAVQLFLYNFILTEPSRQVTNTFNTAKINSQSYNPQQYRNLHTSIYCISRYPACTWEGRQGGCRKQDREGREEGKGWCGVGNYLVILRVKGFDYIKRVTASQVLTCPKPYPNPMDVTGCLAKLKVAYDTIHLSGIPVLCTTFPCYASFGHEK